MTASPLRCSYVIPVRWQDGGGREEMGSYLAGLADLVTETIVVDGSPKEVFDANHRAWASQVSLHLPPDAELSCLNGKVAGVLTGTDRASEEALVIADDDVRYEASNLAAAVELLEKFDLVRPQNYFDPLPWRARWDTSRSLLNRCFGADFPGTLVVRRSRLLSAGGYDGDVLFENLELIRTIAAAGGSTAAPLDLYVRRLPPSASHFRGQRVRQAYDDFALPARMALWLSLLPALALASPSRGGRRLVAAAALAAVALAECGRRRAGGTDVFPATASALAPGWILERGVCAWLASFARSRRGGVEYAGSRIRRAASSEAELLAAAARAPTPVSG